ncbi:TRAP transporter substrate-binding protein DctP [Cupriavidus numazuensis]|uniref:Solute-binding protein n=1 Tax=Cupriavidus numazuensis TaxID=221992 RepID=A0ABM8TV21_9BURK|nr:TRAP transporter substrate-binding protein DctP [Cupriavidus numazuensis]CAG2160440.1 Solute-binding protein [Cupriavidus numazuensis]
MFKLLKRLAATAVLGLLAVSAAAEEAQIRLATAFPENTSWVQELVKWSERVNSKGKGLVKINFIGGPRAIPTFEIGNAVKSGVVDMALSPGAFYTNVFPEADMLKMAQIPVSEQRKNGAIEYINKVWNEKGNMVYLARMVEGYPFHIYLTQKIDKLDLTGKKIRVSPAIRPAVQALNGNVINIPPGEIYTALERSVIDGYGWSIGGIFDLKIAPLTKFRVDPGFYDADVSLIMNLDKWKSMTPQQRDFIQKMAMEIESNSSYWHKEGEDEKKKQNASGIQPLTFGAAETAKYLDAVYEAGWSDLIKTSPIHGPKLRALLSKEAMRKQ